MTGAELMRDLDSRRGKSAGIASDIRKLPTHQKALYGISLAAALSSIARGVSFLNDRRKGGAGLVEMRYLNEGDLKKMMAQSSAKQASIGSALLTGLVLTSPFMVTNVRHLSTWAKAKGADNAWSDALKEKPIRVLVPGLKSKFKQLYVDSPYAADRLLDQF